MLLRLRRWRGAGPSRGPASRRAAVSSTALSTVTSERPWQTFRAARATPQHRPVAQAAWLPTAGSAARETRRTGAAWQLEPTLSLLRLCSAAEMPP